MRLYMMVAPCVSQQLRVGIVPYGAYVRECVLEGNNFSTSSHACGARGIGVSAAAFSILASALTSAHYTLEFVDITQANDSDDYWAATLNSIGDNIVDLAMDLWEATPGRLEEAAPRNVAFSYPLMYTKEVFVVSSKALVKRSPLLQVQPFDKYILAGATLGLLAIILLDGVHAVAKARRRLAESSGHVFLKQIRKAVWDFLDFSGLRNHLITQRRIGFALTGIWIFVTALMRSGLGSFITANLIQPHQPPFQSFSEMFYSSEQFRLVSILGDDIFELPQNALHQDLQKSTIYVNEVEEAIQLLDQQPNRVYTTADLVSYLEIEGQCNKFRTIENKDRVDEGLSVVYRNTTCLQRVLREAIFLIQTAAQTKAEAESWGFTCSSDLTENAYSVSLNVNHFRQIFLLFSLGCIIAGTAFLLELTRLKVLDGLLHCPY